MKSLKAFLSAFALSCSLSSCKDYSLETPDGKIAEEFIPYVQPFQGNYSARSPGVFFLLSNKLRSNKLRYFLKSEKANSSSQASLI
jgi:hypothetical protein